jgi:hypothetical protein
MRAALGDWTGDQPMKTSTKMLVAAAILLGGTSATLAQSVNDPPLFGGGSIGSNRNLNSSLQNSLPFPRPEISHVLNVAYGSSVNDPILFGGGSIGSNRNLNSSLQNARPYPGPESHLQTIAWGSSVNDPAIYGGGSIGSNRNLNSSLQNSRKYPW